MTGYDRVEAALGAATAAAIVEMVREEVVPALRAEWVAALSERERQQEGGWLPAEVAARRLGISRAALYARIRRGLPSSKSGRRIYISQSDIDAEMERKRRHRR